MKDYDEPQIVRTYLTNETTNEKYVRSKSVSDVIEEEVRSAARVRNALAFLGLSQICRLYD